jgi:hypothetical protein
LIDPEAIMRYDYRTLAQEESLFAFRDDTTGPASLIFSLQWGARGFLIALAVSVGVAFQISRANDRFFTLTEDDTPKECDYQTWKGREINPTSGG